MDKLTLQLASYLQKDNSYGFYFNDYLVTFNGGFHYVKDKEDNHYISGVEFDEIIKDLEEDVKNIPYINEDRFTIEIFIRNLKREYKTFDKWLNRYANTYTLKGEYGSVLIDFLGKDAFVIYSKDSSKCLSVYEDAEKEVNEMRKIATKEIYGTYDENLTNKLTMWAFGNYDDVLLDIIKKCNEVSVWGDRTIYDIKIDEIKRTIYINKDKGFIAMNEAKGIYTKEADDAFKYLISAFDSYSTI